MLVLEIKQVAGNEAPIPHCVVRAGAGLGRVMRDVAPGKLGATLALRTQTAEVEIPYPTVQYGIAYKSSSNLQEGAGSSSATR